jgi:hypothetical protein
MNIEDRVPKAEGDMDFESIRENISPDHSHLQESFDFPEEEDSPSTEYTV